MAIITEPIVRSWLPQAASSDAVSPAAIALAITQAQNRADRFVGYALASAARDEYHDIESGEAQILLRAYPVTVVTQVDENTGTAKVPTWTERTEDTDFRVDYETGIATRLGTTWKSGRRAVRAQYTAGWTITTLQTTGPFDALLELTGWILSSRGDTGTTTDSVDGHSRTKEPLVRGVPASIASMLEPYRRIVY